MLATIVGSANGRSMTALTRPLPRKSSRTSTHAIRVPVTTLTSATISEIVSVSRNAARAAGAVAASHSPGRPLSSDFAATAASGSSTMTLNHSVATPSPTGPTPPATVRCRRRRAERGARAVADMAP
jgi:hypothetical protein